MWPFRKKVQDEEVMVEEGLVNTDNTDNIDEPVILDESGIPIEQDEEFIPIEDGVVRGLKKILRGFILAVIALVPIFMLPFSAPGDVLGTPKQLLIFAAAFFGFCLWLAIIIKQGGAVLKRSKLEIGIFAVLVGWLISTIFSPQMAKSFLAGSGIITFTSLALMLFIVVNFFEKKDISKLSNYFLLGTFLALFFGLLNIFGVPMFKYLATFSTKDLQIGRQFNSVGTMNALGGLSVIALIFSISQLILGKLKSKVEASVGIVDEAGLEIEEKPESSWVRFFWMIIKGLVIALSAIMLLMLNWWVFYTAIAVSMLTIAFTPGIVEKLTGQKLRLKTSNIIGPLLILGISLLLLFGGKYININYPGKDKIVPEVSLSNKSSYVIAKSALDERPIFGFGADNYYLAYDKYRPASMNATSFWSMKFVNGSSELINTATMGGAIAILGFLVFVYYMLVHSSRIVKRSSDFQGATSLWVVMPAFISALILFGLYSFNITLYFALWLIAAMIAVSVKNNAKDIKVAINSASLAALSTSLAFVLVLVAGAIGGYVLIQKYTGEVLFAQAARTNITNRTSADKVINMLVSAQNSGSGDIKYLNGLGQILVAQINGELKNTTDKKEDIQARLQNLTKSAVDVASVMTTRYGIDATSWLNAGIIYQGMNQILTGADDAAVNALNEYTKRAPNDPNGFMRIGTIYLTRADRNSAALAEAKRQRLTIKNEKEVVDRILTDYKNAETNFKKASELKTDLALAYYDLGIAYERQNKIPDAIKQLELLANAQLNNPSLAFELGLLYYRNNQKDKSYAEMARAVSLFKDYSNAKWYMALMLEEQGKIDLAINQLDEILMIESNKGNQVVIDKIAALEAGKREIPPAKVTSKEPLK